MFKKAKAILLGETYLPMEVMTGFLVAAIILVCSLGGCADMRQATVTDTGQMLDSSGNPIYPSMYFTKKDEENLFEQSNLAAQ